MAEANTVYGEVDVADARLETAQRATPDELVAIAERLWGRARTALGLADEPKAKAKKTLKKVSPTDAGPTARAVARARRPDRAAVEPTTATTTSTVAATSTATTTSTVAAASTVAAPLSDRELSATLDRLHKSEPDFAQSFPLVLRWMVFAGEFDAAIFREYVYEFASTRPKSREDFRDLQVKYPVALWKAKLARSRPGTHDDKPARDAVEDFRTQLLKQLKDEDETFEKSVKEAEAEVARITSENAADRRRLLVEALRARSGVDE